MKWNPSTTPVDPAPAPNDPTGPTSTNPSDSIETLIQSAVAEGFAQLRKELSPPRRFTNPAESDLFRVPATVKRYSSLKHFTGSDADERAYRFGMFCLGIYGKKQGIEFCHRHGIPLVLGTGDVQTKVQHENLNTSSGFLVPDEFQNDLIDLREKFGVFRRNAKVVPMASDTRSDPRRVNGVTAYFVGESTAASLSDKTWDRVRMTAKKLMVLTKYSNELTPRSLLNVSAAFCRAKRQLSHKSSLEGSKKPAAQFHWLLISPGSSAKLTWRATSKGGSGLLCWRSAS